MDLNSHLPREKPTEILFCSQLYSEGEKGTSCLREINVRAKTNPT